MDTDETRDDDTLQESAPKTIHRVRIAITGTTGRLGAALARVYSQQGFETHPLPRTACDLRDPGEIETALRGIDFDFLVHCAAVTSVDYCESNPEEARAVNAEAPGVIARHCAGRGARMAHVSTDYVYSGDSAGHRVESDPCHPRSVYGRSKLEGERRVLDASAGFLVLRTSWIFGPDRPGFPEQMIHRACETDDLEAICDKFSTPTHSHDFASLLLPLLENPDAEGVFNLSNSGACSWKEYGECALEAAKEAGIPVQSTSVRGIRLAEMKSFQAPRPANTPMSTSRYAEFTGQSPRPWQDALREYVHGVRKTPPMNAPARGRVDLM